VSIERAQRTDGVVWRVRWRDERGRNRSKVLGRKRDAVAFDAEVRRLKRTRQLGQLDAGKQTLAAFAQEWWQIHALPNLAPATLKNYATLLDAHIVPRLGDLALHDLTAEQIQRFRVELETGGTGPASTRKTLALLQGILQRACEWGRLPTNPAVGVRKPPMRSGRAVTPLSPATLEHIRRHLLEHGRPRDATLVSVLAYAGLRPGEALALSWQHIRERTILVDGALSVGEIGATKTARTRTVALLPPLARDLAEWRLLNGRPADRELIFPGVEGQPWTPTAYRNWRRRIYAPVAEACGVEHPRPYDLRHSFVSLLIQQGMSVVEVARQAGHSPTMTLTTYAHVFDELAPDDRIPAEEQIRRARDKYVPVLYPRAAAEDQGRGKSLQINKPSSGLEPETPSLPWKCSTN
jgi:integrase